MPCHAAVSMVWLFANSPYADRANTSEPHLRIPAEYQCRPCEQREAGDSGWRWATDDSRRLAAAVVDGTGRKSEKKGKERRAVRVDRARVASSVSSCRSLISPKRCTLVLPSRSILPALAALFRATMEPPLNSHVTLPAITFHISVPNDPALVGMLQSCDGRAHVLHRAMTRAHART
jgi:hypothetical protein